MKKFLSLVIEKTGDYFLRIKNYPKAHLLASNWYNSKFPHLRSFQNIKRDTDIIALGSSTALHDINFSEIKELKASNLAVGPETITYDFKVLMNYHSYLRDGGIILFVLCPFTFCKDKYRNENGSNTYKNIRYYPILHRALIDNFNEKIYDKWVKHPFRIGPEAWYRWLIDISPKEAIKSLLHKNTLPRVLSDAEMEIHAKRRIELWKKEFNMRDLDVDNIPQSVKESIDYNKGVFREMLSFLKDRGYEYMVIIPPFSEELTAKIPQEFSNYTLFNPLKEVGAQVLSFLGDKEWMRRDYFQDTFFMNERGSKILTNEIINRIAKKYILE